jgi:hypothetical protein
MMKLIVLAISAAAALAFAPLWAPYMWIAAVLGLIVLGLTIAQTVSAGRAAGASTWTIASTAAFKRGGLATVAFVAVSTYLFVELGLEPAPGSATAINPRATFDAPPSSQEAISATSSPTEVKPEIDNVVRPGRLRLEDIQVR